ncbi:MAG: N-acetylmuramoyl-L-alanine amidase [Defluviitaleaceae bacterium]|nr:N-acetylmuramoyl-L-alanine amidase [Defluviitaleaceae bacterium]
MRIAISSGHGLFVRGARGIIDEVEEARKVTDRVSAILRDAGVIISTFHENNARTQSENVGAIVRHHNSQARDLDVSIHFNSTATGIIEDRAIGVEVLHFTSNQTTRILAGQVARAISDASGLLLRHQRDSGAVARSNVSFLSNTTAPAILIEVCFVVSRTDVRLYQENFEAICRAIAATISKREISINEEPAQQTVIPPKPVDINATQPLPGQQPSSWAREAWAWGVENGLTDGSNPQGIPTREQMVTLLHRYDNIIVQPRQ